MAKIRLEYEHDFTKLHQAGLGVQKISREADQFGQTMTAAFRTSTREADKFEQQLKSNNQELDKAEKKAEGVSKVGSQFKTAKKDVETFTESLKNMATGFVAGTIIQTGINKITNAISHAIDKQKEFEASLKNLQAITGASAQDIEFYSAKALELGVSVKGGASAAVEAFKLIGSAKPELLANKEALVEVTDSAILLSQAAGLELPDAATRLTDAMNQFGAASDQAGLFVDTLAAGAKFGAAEVPQITEALLKFGAVAKSSNISVQESTAAIELLAEKGLKGSEAGTALRNVFLKLSAVKALPKEAINQLQQAGINTELLSDKSKTLGERLQELSKLQGNEVALVKIFGTENVVAAKSIIAGTQAIDGQIPRLQQLTDQIGKQGLGSAMEQAALNTDTLEQALLEAENQYDNMLLSITTGNFGDILKGFVKDATDSLKSFSDQLKDVGTLFTKGFGAVQDQQLERIAGDVASKLTQEQRKAQAEILAGQVKALNIQLQNNKSLTDDQKKQYSEQIKNKAVFINALLGAEKKSVKDQKELIQDLGETNVSETTKELNERKKLQEDFQKSLDDLRKRVQAAQLEQASPEQRIILQKQFAQEELDLIQAQFEKVAKLAGANQEQLLKEQENFNFLRKAIEQKAADDLLKIQVDQINKAAQARLSAVKANEANLATEEQIKIGNVNLQQSPAGIGEIEFEKAKQKQILDIQREYAMKKLELKQQELDAENDAATKALRGELALLENKNDKESIARREQINENLGILNEKYALETEAAQNATAQLINDIQKKRDQLDQQPPFDLQKFLGANQDNIRNIQSALNALGDALAESLDRQIEKYDQAVNASQERQNQIDGEISDLESQLEKEHELSDRGLANNQDRIAAEIAAKEEQKAKEHELELKAIEDRKKVQKERLILDTILQGSNLVLAATEIYAKAAATGGPAGVPIALGAIAIMLAAFVKQKADAFKAINEGQGFKEGVIDLQGPGTETSDSIPARLSKGESVITAKVTRKRKGLLEALQTDREDLIKAALINELSGTGVVISQDLPKELSSKKDSIRGIEAELFYKTDNSSMEKRLDEVNKKLQAQIDENRNKTYIDQDGNLIKKQGSHTSIIKKKRG